MPREIQVRDVKDASLALDYLIHDLIVAHQLYDLFGVIKERATVHDETEKAVRRMYISYLLLSLDKYSEYYEKYGWLLPDMAKQRCREIHKELVRRKIRKLRHTFIGHILNKDGRPISSVEIDAAFNAATDSDIHAFLKWVHISGTVMNPDTVVGVLQLAHSELCRIHD